ncbi:SLATT domain-containing protein [Kitasatospora sp. NPDC048194]|uniref:SLATT domain-containing protein n=1 Tax=Kitasatospora sp. NPDC048194 TaxID=3364045 RepID=UPI0037138754
MATQEEQDLGPVELQLEQSRAILVIEKNIREAKIDRFRYFSVYSAAPIFTLLLFIGNVAFWGHISLWRINIACIPIDLILIWMAIGMVASDTTDWSSSYIASQKLELELAHERKRLLAAHLNLDLSSRRHIYRESIPSAIERYQRSGTRYRAIHNTFQSVIIMGSLATSTIAALGDSIARGKLLTVAASISVGISAGFTGYFKYRERSFYLQQTADALEEELNSVNLKIGRYRSIADDEDALADFTERVEILQNEQRKRQQQLDQPAQGASPGE